jgi:DNA mismatch repair protein MutS
MIAPARRQYLEIKAEYQDAILLYQVGDFFETFDEDARIAARELQIVLTGRSYGTDERVPLAGVPVHAVENYAAKLVAHGYKVAICEQIGPVGKRLVRREVTRILTPGTVVSPAMVPAARDNYLVAVALATPEGEMNGGMPKREARAGLAYLDASTGTFRCTEWAASDWSVDGLRAELERLGPAEIIVADVPQQSAGPYGPAELTWQASGFAISACPAHFFDVEESRIRLRRHFRTPTLAAFVPEELTLAMAASGAIIAYIERMNPNLLSVIQNLCHYDTGGHLQIDGRTWRALEVVEPAHGPASPATPAATTGAIGLQSQRRGSATLLSILDVTRTLMGRRMLRRTLLSPLRDLDILEERLDAVSELHGDIGLRQRLLAALDSLPDLERLAARVVQGTAVPRELHALRAGLTQSGELARVLANAQAAALKRVGQAVDSCPEAQGIILEALGDTYSATPGGSGTIRPGYSAELDALVASIAEARAWIAGLEATERERTGIKSLKVGFNSVFGYYLEVSNANLARVPPEYRRRQTLVHAERYITAELKERESMVLHAEEQISELESHLYREVLARVEIFHTRIRASAEAVAQIDVWLALAVVADERGYTRPKLSPGTELWIEEGRHPIIEAKLADGIEFVPNRTSLDALEDSSSGTRILLLTGPNMAGKSTYLRQVATIVLLAQIGSYVPATAARIGLVDRICCRVGAEDDLARGMSTFMLEMVETAYILRQSTARSLVILDEVGRGTSTHDGLAIARAVIEYVHDTIGARTLFATHYHELAALDVHLAHLSTCQMEVVEQDGEAMFLHRVIPGASSQSYGIQVARMAGLPASVTQRAAAVLFEENNAVTSLSRRVAESTASAAYRRAQPGAIDVQLPEGVDSAKSVAVALASLNIAALTPLDALNLLFSLQQQALLALRLEGYS